jgi:hypothetical protein
MIASRRRSISRKPTDDQAKRAAAETAAFNAELRGRAPMSWKPKSEAKADD